MPDQSAFWGIVVSCVVLCGCTGLRDNGTSTFLLPRMDANGNTYLEETSLPTLSSPFRVEGSVARVLMNPNASMSSMNGEVAEPHLSKSGHTYVPLDAESGLTLSVYAFFERMYSYELRVLLDSKISWPRTIGVYERLTEMPPGMENNVLYLGSPADAYALLPYDDAGRVALALNDGVLGHEHFHAHFDRLVISQMPELKNASPSDLALALSCPQSTLQFELLMVRSWNEGLADFYGALISGTPKFMKASLPTSLSRDLTKSPSIFNSASAIRQAITSNAEVGISASAKGCANFDPYFNGEQLARILYKIADNGDFPVVLETDGSRYTKYERAARYLIHRLQGFSKDLQAQSWPSVEVDFILQYLLNGVSLSSSSCHTIQSAIPDLKGYPQCAGL